MTNPIIKIHNVQTNEIIEREMNAQEFAQYETDQAKAIHEQETKATKAAEKAALLAKLGISDDEAKLLLS
jgi:hypothetical protein